MLTGVSCSGKTPSCLYLALQFGIKAANYPQTEKDIDYEHLPEKLYVIWSYQHDIQLAALTIPAPFGVHRLANFYQQHNRSNL